MSLVGFYWDVAITCRSVAVTGGATLSGAVGPVMGLRGKALATAVFNLGVGLLAGRLVKTESHSRQTGR